MENCQRTVGQSLLRTKQRKSSSARKYSFPSIKDSEERLRRATATNPTGPDQTQRRPGAFKEVA